MFRLSKPTDKEIEREIDAIYLSRLMQTESRFGFIYKTTPGHVEEGEERFEVLLDEKSDAVWYENGAVSRPRNLIGLLGYPITRGFQHRFARDSHKRMKLAVACR